MTWDNFIWFALPAVICWLAAGSLVFVPRFSKRLPEILMIIGVLIFAVFITGFWIGIERPPMRTMGETRLWYSFFLPLFGYIAYCRWRFRWILSFSAVLATVFVFVNLLNPEMYSKSLMPALQSPWFIPHVVTYMLSYAMLGAATIGSFIQMRKLNKNGISDEKVYDFMDNTVYIGFGMLMLGLLIGAVWANDVWGTYWGWDPKETWAFITCVAYLAYIHVRWHGRKYEKFALWMLPVSFLLLMITWKGVNYLPAAQGSAHVY
jgi:ABC-type transport system involved in cytochrome c biogenesis permease subunit